MREINRKKFAPHRQKYYPPRNPQVSDIQKSPDILDVWKEQKRLRSEETRLQEEYELAKRRVKQLQIQIKKRNNLLADADDLQTSAREDLSRGLQNSRLWTVKAYRQFKLRLTVIYLKTRLKLGFPLRARSNFLREKLALAAVAIVVVGAFWGLSRQAADETAVQGQSESTNPIELGQQPEFSVLEPADKDIAKLGGFAKINPEGSATAYAYIDELDGVKIRVSQQQLPSNIKNDPDELQKLALNFNAKRTLIAGDRVVYVSESKSGSQSLILQKNDLLILISSDGKISDDSWTSYVNSLVPA